MVQLEQDFEKDLAKVVTTFQFHYGSIRTRVKRIYLEYLTRFQFHYGSIRTPADAILDRPLFLFQFHYGSIRTRGRTFPYSGNVTFNSIMVQLEH